MRYTYIYGFFSDPRAEAAELGTLCMALWSTTALGCALLRATRSVRGGLYSPRAACPCPLVYHHVWYMF